MKLGETICALTNTDSDLCIVAKRPWTPESDAQLIRLSEDGRVPASTEALGYLYFLEVSIVLDEVLNDLGKALTDEQRIAAVIYYAEFDAYPEWLSQMRHFGPSGSV
jgi:hypothetical protein